MPKNQYDVCRLCVLCKPNIAIVDISVKSDMLQTVLKNLVEFNINIDAT